MVSLNDVLLAYSNIPVDDPIAEIWGRGLQGGYEIIEYTGTLPITIVTNGTALINYCIYGNTEQDGTPTPEAPVDVVGCGEKVDITGFSEPLCGIDIYTDSLDLSTGVLTRRIKKLVLTGEEGWSRGIKGCYYINLSNGCPADYLKSKVVTVMCSHYKGQINTNLGSNEVNNGCICFFTGGGFELYIGGRTIATPADFKSYLAAQYAAGTPITIWYVLANPEVSTIPVPSGLTGTIEGYLIQDGTPTPETPIYPTANGIKQADDTYSIPYGYKLPILSNSTVTNIYLGEAETTRRIKKLVLTGEEGITQHSIVNNIVGVRIPTPTIVAAGSPIICTHATNVSWANYYGFRTYAMVASNASAGNLIIYMSAPDSEHNTLSDIKSYLASQYAAGTPVTVWYVLAEPETGIVNEPLMKIGNYADTVSMKQAGASIPTFTSTTVIDYDGAPKPSQMYVKYKGKG